MGRQSPPTPTRSPSPTPTQRIPQRNRRNISESPRKVYLNSFYNIKIQLKNRLDLKDFKLQ